MDSIYPLGILDPIIEKYMHFTTLSNIGIIELLPVHHQLPEFTETHSQTLKRAVCPFLFFSADLRLYDSANLTCDESSLTGESHPCEKNHNFVADKELALGDRKNMLYSGNVITNGRAVGIVVAVGKQTEIGKIASILQNTGKEETPLQKNIKTIGKILTIIIMAIAVVTFILELVLRPDEPIIEAFLIAVALAVAAIPESLPAVITIIMSMGVNRLAKKKAIIKRLHAVETLGCCEVICSDKTGTLRACP